MPLRLASRPLLLAGREELLAELDVRLSARRRPQGPRVAVLCGLGGAGKTSVAIEYAYRHLAEVGVCWQFAAEDPAVLEAEFGVLAAELGAREVADPRDPVASVHGVLARSATGWLVVFDNATDRRSVERFVPPAGNGRVLITTQDQHWPPGLALDVPVLDIDVAADFLVARTGDADQGAARELAREQGGLPLALAQAAAYMQATGTSLAQYLPLFHARQAELLARGVAPGHPATVAATLGLALSRLAAETPAAVGLARLLAFLAPEPVPLGLLLADGKAVDSLGPETARQLGPLLGDLVAVGDAIAALRHYSLVSLAGAGLVMAHRLVQAITRAQIPARSVSQWQQAAAALVDHAVPADPQLSAAWSTCALLLPHARAVLDMTSDSVRRIAQYLAYSGSYPAARDLFSLILGACRDNDAYGPDHPDTLIAQHNLAHWSGWAGDLIGARDQYKALLPIIERVLGAEHPDTLATRHYLAFWTVETGDAAGARDQLAALLPIEEQVLGPDHPITLTTRHSLATRTGEAGDAARSRDQLAELLPIRAKVLGPEHPDTLITRQNLADRTGEAGDPVDARDQLTALLAIREKVLGPEHPATLATRQSIAQWTGVLEGAAKARDQHEVLLPIHERVLGPEHPNTLAALHELARWTGDAGDAAKARDHYAALVPSRERVWGPSHRGNLWVRHRLAHWTGQAGDPAGARDQLTALLPIREKFLGPEHPDTLTTRHDLAYWTGTSGDSAGARDQLTALLAIRDRVQGPEHPDTLATRHDLAYWKGKSGIARQATAQRPDMSAGTPDRH